jgi:hypothetical protein
MTPDDQGLVPLLRPGRTPLTVEDLRRLAVDAFPTSGARPALWAAFMRARLALAPLVSEIQVGGSFVSSKLQPKDIDLLAVLRPDCLPPPRDQRLDEFLQTAGYILGEHLGVDLALVYEGDDARLDRWLRWIEWGKPYLRTELTQNRGVAVVRIADARADSH